LHFKRHRRIAERKKKKKLEVGKQASMSNNNKYRINIAEKYIGNHRDFFFQSNKQVGHDANRFDANKRGEFISPIQ
jgi:hypothetical protein